MCGLVVVVKEESVSLSVEGAYIQRIANVVCSRTSSVTDDQRGGVNTGRGVVAARGGDPGELGLGVDDGDGERAAGDMVARPLDVQHVLADLGRVVAAEDRPVACLVLRHFHTERSCTAQPYLYCIVFLFI